jgi:biopolymer transport protein ExbB
MKLRNVALFGALVALSALVLGPEAVAQEAEGGGGESLFTLISYGGFIGYFTIFLSFVGIGVAIEHFINVRMEVLMPPVVLEQVEQLFEEGEYEEAMQICETQPSYFTNILAAALPKVGTGYENIEKAFDQANDDEAVKLFTKISHINYLANVAPMLGLLGTVTGMMMAFAEIAGATTPDPQELAKGIQQAIVTTVIGLTVSIPMSALFHFFRFRVINLVTDISGHARDLIERFQD